jgi:hypothetical protein
LIIIAQTLDFIDRHQLIKHKVIIIKNSKMLYLFS